MLKAYKVTKEGDIKHTSVISSNVKWIDLVNPSQKEIDDVSSFLKIRSTSIKSCIDKNEVPRIKEYTNHTLVIFREPSTKGTRPIGFIIKDGIVLTVHKSETVPLEFVPRPFKPKTFLLELLSNSIEAYDHLLDVYINSTDHIESDALEGKDVRHDLFNQKKHLIFIRKALNGNKEVITRLNSNLFKDKKNTERLYELQTNIYQHIETAALIQDRMAEITNISLATMSNKLNEIMKTFTVLALIFMVPTLIAGIYGMNFRAMPEIYWTLGYPFSLGLMAISVLILYAFFKVKKWM